MKLAENLRLFNTKERFHLIGLVLGNTKFSISDDFMKQLNETFDGLDLQKDESYFAAMDYHIDWLYASLYMTYKKYQQDELVKTVKETVNGTQEDIDFVICVDRESGGKTESHIILLEAKGATAWSNGQMKSKAGRFGVIFGDDGKKWLGVTPYFAIVSPGTSKRLQSNDWPSWMTKKGVKHIKMKNLSELLNGSPDKALRKVTRYNEQRKPDKNGEFWKIENIKKIH